MRIAVFHVHGLDLSPPPQVCADVGGPGMSEGCAGIALPHRALFVGIPPHPPILKGRCGVFDHRGRRPCEAVAEGHLR